MRKISTFFYCILQGLKNIHRNGMFSLASIGTIAASLFLIGIFYFVTANFSHMMQSAESSVGVTVFFEEDITEEEILELQTEIKKRAEVAEIVYISAEEAWEEYKEKHLNEDLIATFGNDNPLEDSASFEIYLNDVEMQTSLVKYLEGLNGIRRVNDAGSVVESLTGINYIITGISAAIIIILIGVAIFLINMTISTGISVRKEEISIMHLIGATDFFVHAPFVVEGMMLGLCGALLPLVVLKVVYEKVVFSLSDEFESVFYKLNFMSEEAIFHELTPLVLTIGVGIGFLGSYITARKQLRKIDLR